MSRLKCIKDDSNNVIAEYEYDALGRRTLLSLANDANAVYKYDIGNRLTKLTNNIDDTNTITFEYADYDKVGNRKSMKIDDANAHVYTYDALYQLTNVDYNDGNSTGYWYDDLGNRTKTDDGSVTTYLHNILNQYYSVGGTSFSYDDNGNLIDDGTYEYYYDCENRLTDVNENDAVVATYEYDYLGRRISKTVDSNTTEYVYDGDQVVAEYENDTLVRKFVYGPGIDEPICIVDVSDSNAVYYYHYDGLGSVVALSDVNREIVERYSYDVFGEPNTASSIGNPYLFTGRRLDDETGLYYYRARYYNPEIGRFLQTDPIGYYDSMNLYQCCLNNPVNWIDPYGENVFGGFVSWIAGSGWDNSVDMGSKEAKELAKATGTGAIDGLIIARNEYTFHLIDKWNKAASKKVSEYGAVGRASQIAARVSRDAFIAAVGAKGFEKFTGIRFEFHGTHGHSLPHIQAIKGPGWGKTLWRFPPH